VKITRKQLQHLIREQILESGRRSYPHYYERPLDKIAGVERSEKHYDSPHYWRASYPNLFPENQSIELSDAIVSSIQSQTPEQRHAFLDWLNSLEK